ncbi:hypothetical protein AB0M02_35850 [Actinoplanes sp. NPDC051861]|uniref:hypothetical protein n=1 Tax=Actinoplanes sp. NPDC051861 TaxID=3155170 RepID=UPI003440D089
MRRQIDVSRTGPATATNGGVAISGVHQGDIHVHGQAPSRSVYRDRVVAGLAPKSLGGRQTEIEELVRFCTRRDGDSYVWWQGPAWSGKTALLSWFVLNPPPGVGIVSFFITARFKGHADRSAFLEFVLEQFSEILDEPMPMVTDASAEVAFLDRLARAAQLFAERDERLVLVVDGLDEDRGVMASPDAYSIAALLPEDLPVGVKVIVSGRPNPPVPDDVPSSHPLRDSSVVRMLTTSPHATAVKRDMRSEIRRLLLGSHLERELLGLITAAGGGLSGRDLAELIQQQDFLVNEHLRTVSGRTFARRAAGWGSESQPEVYLLGHEEIQVEAIDCLGETALRNYRERIHVWADSYRELGWPAETPDYLLRGYHRLVQELRDLPRMLALGTDSKRHDRLFSVTGGDFAALAEIGAVQMMLHADTADDLAALGRVAVHRLRVISRAKSMRVNLPQVWARLGQAERAETLARSMPDPARRAWALAGVARAVADRGHIEEALRVAASIAEPRWQAYGLTGIARALAVSGDVTRARQLAQEAENSIEGPEALAGLMEVHALCGDGLHRFLPLSDKDAHFFAGPLAATADIAGAQDVLESVTEPRWRTYALIGIARALAAAGNRAHAQVFAARAIAEASNIDDSVIRGFALAPLVAVLSGIGEREQAKRTAEQIERDIAVANSTRYEAYAWAELAKAVAATGDMQRAGKFADRAEEVSLAETMMDRERAALVRPLLAIGEPELALRTATQVADPHTRAWALCATAEASPGTVITAARATAGLIPEPESRLGALGAVADAALRVGDIATATELRDAFVEEAATPNATESPAAGVALALAVAVSVRLGDPDQARELAHRLSSIANPSVRTYAAHLALSALATHADVDLTREIVRKCENMAIEAQDDFTPIHTIAVLAEVDKERARNFFERSVRPVLDPFDEIEKSMILTEGSDPKDERARFRRDWKRLSIAQVVQVAALIGDSGCALAITHSMDLILDRHPEEWDDPVRVILLGAMARIGESVIACGLAAKIRSEPIQAWAMAETALDSDQRRTAIGAALRVDDWLPIWQPSLSPQHTAPPELRIDLPLVPARCLAVSAPEALRAIADELIQV